VSYWPWRFLSEGDGQAGKHRPVGDSQVLAIIDQENDGANCTQKDTF